MNPHRTRIKICGLRDAALASVAAEAGADAVGIVFHPPSPRHASLEEARAVALALPAFVAEADWNEHERKSYARVLAIGEALAIRTFDLRPAVAELATAGIAMEETPGDRWHPNDAAAAAIARVLERAGFVP